MKMDKQFIAVFFYSGPKSTRIYSFSKKTHDLYWQKTIGVHFDNFAYGQGILLSHVVKQSESEKFGLIKMHL
jgi:hypothetical protein